MHNWNLWPSYVAEAEGLLGNEHMGKIHTVGTKRSFTVPLQGSDAQLEPVPSYVAEAEGLLGNEHMGKIHTVGTKRSFTVPLQGSNRMVYGETGRYPLQTGARIKCTRYWMQVVKYPAEQVIKPINMLLNQFEGASQSWSCPRLKAPL